MASLIHIAEVAALLLVAYVLGWAIGYVARLIALRRPAKAPVIPAERLAVAKGEAADPNALVKAPVLEPVNMAPRGAMPVVAVAAEAAVTVEAGPLPITPPEPAKSGLESLASLAITSPLPAPLPVEPPTPTPADAAVTKMATAAVASPEPKVASVALEPPAVVEEPVLIVTPGLEAALVAVPVAVAPVPPAPEPELAATAPVVAPVPEPPPAPVIPPMPASRPGVPWSGEIKGHAAAPHVSEAPVADAPAASVAATPEPVPVLDAPAIIVREPMVPTVADVEPAAQIEPAVESAGATPESDLLSAVTVALEALTPPPAPEEPAAQPDSLETLPPPPEVVEAATEPSPLPPSAKAEYDEDAAMRAIEGGWSRRAARAMPDQPELIDVSAAVAAAQSAVQQVLAKTGLDAESTEARASAAFGKPSGLPRPRGGAKDNLKEIAGLSLIDESALNNMGIYHFEQIAGWDQKEVLWMENHVLARGRIARENWQQQASELARNRPAPKTARI